MDEKKQIEEMYNSLSVAYSTARQMDSHLRAETAEDMARRLVKDGYRKQSVGEWKTVDETNNHKVVECTNCKEQFYFAKKGQLQIDRMPLCPNCGAKMKGEWR